MAYTYKASIEKKLIAFEVYLQSKRYAPDTIRQARNYAGVYLEWLEEQGMTAGQVEYRELTDFIFQLKKDERPISEGVKHDSASRERTAKAGGRHYSANLARRILLAVRHYYESLGIDKNPATGGSAVRSATTPSTCKS